MDAALPTAFRQFTVTQVAILVPDLAAAVRTYSSLLGLEDWLVYTYTPENVPHLGYRGGAGQYSMRLALAGASPQIELIQPLQGPSIYHDWIDDHGFGFHHLGMHVPDVAAVQDQLVGDGWLPIQTGRGYGIDNDGGFAYYDTQEQLGLVLEVIEVPATRRPSETL